MFICPNKYLVEQTSQEAEKFGIGYVTIEDDLPDEFLNSEKILITHVQKVFNGKSKFGVGGKFQKVNTIILDDSHACIDSINDSFKIKVNNEHQLWEKLLQLFEDDWRGQGEGSLEEIKSKSKESHNTLLPVPYWSWQDKKSEVIKVILESGNENEVKFAWPLIKDNLENCQCFISGKELEISTILSPISKFGSFSKAEHRILMSATTQNDSFFVKGLGLNIEAVKNPLIDKNERWSGEKMILIPWLIHEELKETSIINKFAEKDVNRKVGCVVITSSFKKAETYEKLGSIVVKSDNIFKEIGKLKSGDYSNTIVFANRYDGIDLPDNSCRILIIDSMPYSSSLFFNY